MKNMWFIFAILAAVFAAATAILTKVGIEGVDSNLATAITWKTIVGCLLLLAGTMIMIL